MANYTGNPSNIISSNSPFSFLDINDFNWESLNPFMANAINYPACSVQNSNLDYQSLMGYYNNDQIPTHQTSQLLHAKLLGDSNTHQAFNKEDHDHVSEQFDSSVISSSANGNECSGRSTNKRKKAEDFAESSSSLYSTSDLIKMPNNDQATKKKNSIGRGKRRKSEENSKEVVHVRARRGQATDSHSIAERLRRGKINERLKCLQDIVPGCYKSMGMAVMLDEIINYVQSLQNQVEFLSMKLTAASHFHDFNSEPEHVEKKQKIKACNSDEAQDVGYDNEALLPPNVYQSTTTTWPF